MSTRHLNSARAEFVVASALLVAYGNAKSYVDLVILGSTWGGSLFGVAAGVLLVGPVGLLARRWGLSRGDLGLSPAFLGRGLVIGVVIGIPVALLLSGGLFVGTLLTESTQRLAEVSPVGQTPWADLLRRVLVLMWLDTAIPEEVAFRGLLLGLLLNTPMRPLRAVIWSAVPFTLWHVVVVWQDGGSPPALVYAGKLAGIFVGGLYFGALRLRSGHLLASIISHWAYDVFAVLTVRLLISL